MYFLGPRMLAILILGKAAADQCAYDDAFVRVIPFKAK